MRTFIYGILITSLFACGSKQGTLDQVIGTAHFRGNSIGDKRQKVSSNVAADNITVQDEMAVTCELKVQETDMLVRYDFDGDALYSIQADMFFSDSTALTHFQESLIEHYNAKYGQVNVDGGFLVWQEGGKVEFTLADESIEFGQPKLSLTIYNFDY
ncbi:MAG: hypothetical protein RL266_1693 [Bacteroidota bacterium]|jgi:hypothetical protein